MKGGYINIDASGLNIHNTTKQTIKGFYKQVLKATKINKPVFVYNTISNEYGKISPFGVFCYFVSENENVFLTAPSMEIIVDKNDGVLVRVVNP